MPWKKGVCEGVKKWKGALLLSLILCLIPLFQALASTGTVTAHSLNMRASASTTAKIIRVLKEGATVNVLSRSGNWYKISYDGRTGYVAKNYLKIGSSSKKTTPKSTESSDGTCSVGDKGEAVKIVQKKLKSLGYYTGSIDGDYGNGTKKAVLAFQKNNGLKQTGNVNSATLKKLKSGNAKKAGSSSKETEKKSTSSDGTCSVGDKGSAVREVQRRLKKLGYLAGEVDGDYGNGTKRAVIAFQKRNGLKQTGSVNSATLKKLKSSDAKKASSSNSSSDSSSGGKKTEALYWFKNGNKAIPKRSTFQVKDIKTGKIFTCKRWSGVNHCDTEPLTAKDTKIMKSIVGHWSWRRRAILVKYNGHVYAASMNAMPHGTGTISNNNFDGHFCIHFLGSKTHGSKKVDSMHQNCVKTALKHTW